MPLDGLRGHRELYARLLAELHSRPAHAYLFAGPGGVGKALLAEALVHSLLCERTRDAGFCCRPDRCPVREAARASTSRGAAPAARCECCAGCVQVATGVHPDFIRIGRAAGRTEVSIEQVRNLIARLGTRPARAPMRAAIIDDGETLNLPAQNALLKTLEEPPGFTIIFLIAHSERALLETVRSRLRMVRFPALAAAEIAAILIERLQLEPERAQALALLARGSAAHGFALAAGSAPPMAELLGALERAATIDFAAAQALAQDFFASRAEALGNFELIARLLEEMLCCKLLGAQYAEDRPAAGAENMRAMAGLVDRLELAAILTALEGAVRAATAVEAMANPRLQAESWWMEVARAARGEA
ncbi:MAG TPA: DNA polymerase III subunit [Candidatus Binataceae bacterium]|nr:DNA polymerase III subunit [Candidatus Binataceae bacterium]